MKAAGIILMLIGIIITYGASVIMKFLNIREKYFILVKLIGLTAALTGALIIFA